MYVGELTAAHVEKSSSVGTAVSETISFNFSKYVMEQLFVCYLLIPFTSHKSI